MSKEIKKKEKRNPENEKQVGFRVDKNDHQKMRLELLRHELTFQDVFEGYFDHLLEQLRQGVPKEELTIFKPKNNLEE